MEQIGGYVLDEKLGAGGMGAVFRARHPRFPGRTFALKVLVAGAPDPAARERFEREMKALAIATQHPNVVRIYGGSVEGERPYYVMELVEGSTLGHLVAPGAPLDPVRAARILHGVADAMAHVHANGVVHRDLKPGNVLVEPGDRPRVCDFGLARLADAERLTRTGIFLGTVSFAAPEQLDGRSHDAGPPADVYALGAVLYFALTGSPPFQAGNDRELARRVFFDAPAAPSARRKDVPAALDAVCLRALAKEPADRYANAAGLRDDLARFLAGEPVRARAPGAGELLRGALRRRRRELRIVLAGVLVAAAAGAIGFKVRTDARERRAASERLRDDALALRDAAAVEAKLELLASADDDVKEAVAAHLRVRKEVGALSRELGAAGAAAVDPSAKRLLEDAAEAIAAPGSSALALDDALLDRREVLLGRPRSSETAAVASALLLAADRLAVARRGAEDAGARREASLLEALSALARQGGPRRPLGTGRLGVAPAPVLAALEAASAGQDAVAARASALEVDLELGAADDRAARATLAGHAALDPADRASFERVLATPFTADGFARLLPADDERRAGELALFFALGGSPTAVEHPELASEGASVSEAAARDHPVFALPSPEGSSAADGPAAESYRIARVLLNLRTGGREFEQIPLAEIEATWRPVAARFEEAVDAGMRLDPTRANVLKQAAYSMRGRLTAGIFRVLASREDTAVAYDAGECFSSELRRLTRGGWTTEYYPLEVWDPEGAAPWEEFDRKLGRAVDEDPLAGYLAPLDRALAAKACRALYRLDVLHEAEDGVRAVDEPTRARIAFEALRDVDAYSRLGGAAALPFRARARRFAVPGKLGLRLEELDLRRALAAIGEVPGTAYVDPFKYGVLAAALASDDAALVSEGLELDLYDASRRLLLAREHVEKEQGEKGTLPEIVYLTSRPLTKKLRGFLRSDPRHADFEKDFDPQ